MYLKDLLSPSVTDAIKGTVRDGWKRLHLFDFRLITLVERVRGIEKGRKQKIRGGRRGKQEWSGGTAVACLSDITSLTFVFHSID